MSDGAGVRLNRYLAQCGVASRRGADALIEAGRVTVDGMPGTAGMKVPEGGEVRVDGEPVRPSGTLLVYAYYKPRGVVCTERDPHADRTIYTELRDHPAFASGERLLYIGRLDRESEGLLLLTNDGALKRRLELAESGKDKEYLVETDRTVPEETLSRFRKGMHLDDLGIDTRPCLAERVSDREIRMILTEGKNRQIRRMCEAEGLRVTRLLRVRILSVTLAELHPGEIRALSDAEIKELDI